MKASSDNNSAVLTALRHHVKVKSIEDVDRSMIDAAGGIEAIIQAMTSLLNDSSVQIQALHILALLTTDESYNEEVVAHGGIEICIQAMKRHTANQPIEQVASVTLCQLLSAEDFAPRFCEAGGVETIIRSMIDNPNDVGCQQEACYMFDRVAQDDNIEHRDRIIEAGGIEAIICAMNRHVTSLDLEIPAFSAFRYLLQTDSQDDARARVIHTKAFNAGAIDAIIKAMKQHPNEKLTAIAYDIFRNHTVVSQTGGVETIIGIMQGHADEERVQYHSLLILSYLSNNEEASIKINKLDGIEAIIKAMTKFRESAGIQDYACRTLARVLFNDEKGKDAVAAAAGSSGLLSCADIGGAIRAIVIALKHHASYEAVQIPAISALSLLTHSADNLITIKAAGGVEAILGSMKQHEYSTDMQDRACHSLFHLACNDTIRQDIIASGGVAAICEYSARKTCSDVRRPLQALGKLNYGNIAGPMGDISNQCILLPKKRQKKEDSIDHSKQLVDTTQSSNHKAVDFFTEVRPSSVVLSFVSNYEFYCTIPSLSRAHQSMMHDDGLHQRQCRSRLRMTDYQFQLFQETRFPLLYIPMNEVESVAEEHRSRLACPSDSIVAQSCDKVWWRECTRLYLHLVSATRFLTRYAPTHFLMEDGHTVAIKYELPRLIQSVLMDELTSFYVFNLLRRYTDDGHHKTIMFEGSRPTLESGDTDSRRIWYDYTKQFDEKTHISLGYCGNAFGDVCCQSADNRLKFLRGESLFLGDSARHECYGYERSHYLWFGPSLKQAADMLAVSFDRTACITINMESAVVLGWDVKNHHYGPEIIAADVQSWLLKAGLSHGDVNERERFRLYKFVYGDHFTEHWCWNTAEKKKSGRGYEYQDEEEREHYTETTYGKIARSLESQSAWWTREQHLYEDMFATKPAVINNHQDDGTSLDEHPMCDMLDQYLVFALETGAGKNIQW